jgi:hypothetical protein
MGEIKALKHSLKKLKNQLSVCQGFKGEWGMWWRLGRGAWWGKERSYRRE